MAEVEASLAEAVGGVQTGHSRCRAHAVCSCSCSFSCSCSYSCSYSCSCSCSCCCPSLRRGQPEVDSRWCWTETEAVEADGDVLVVGIWRQDLEQNVGVSQDPRLH